MGLFPEIMSKLILGREYDFKAKLVDRLEAQQKSCIEESIEL
jgi:hypothetical protein